MLSELDDPTYQELAQSVDLPEPTTSLSTLRDRFKASLSKHGKIDPDLLVESLLAASAARISSAASSVDIAKAVAEFPDLGMAPENLELLVSRLSTLLDSKSLGALAKGLDVLTEHERIYLKARIVTDMRPVYRAGDVIDPAGVVLVHTLRLDVQENTGLKSLYVAMDESDLRQLRQVLQREEDKTVALKHRIESLGVALLDLDDSVEGTAE